MHSPYFKLACTWVSFISVLSLVLIGFVSVGFLFWLVLFCFVLFCFVLVGVGWFWLVWFWFVNKRLFRAQEVRSLKGTEKA